MSRLSIADEVRLTVSNLGDIASDMVAPSLRIGVTGLSRAGKTVFLTSLVQNLLYPERLSAFSAQRNGRYLGAKLNQQPDDGVPRFAFEEHLHRLLDDRVWPESTRQISQLRLTLHFEPSSAFARGLGRSRLDLDFVDYPGEWLLDLPLLEQSYSEFAAQSLAKSREASRQSLARPYLDLVDAIDPASELDEETATKLASAFADYLKRCRADDRSLSMLPPGRFLMPGDMEGSPALTFAPLDLGEQPSSGKTGTFHAAMERRFEAYKRLVVKPFFLEHFARLDRQVILVDMLAAINAGPEAVRDLQDALAAILTCFKPGSRSLISRVLGPKVDRMVFAATKADHLHHEHHDRLGAILQGLVGGAQKKARFSGAKVDTVALGSVRATREATASVDGEVLKTVTGTPIEDERIDGEVFDGEREVAIFPGDLPESADQLFGEHNTTDTVRFVRFRPPKIDSEKAGKTSLPHIRLDRVVEFLVGDQVK